MGGSADESPQRRLAHRRAIHILAAIHQSEKRAEYARLHFVRHRVAARRDLYERLAPLRNLLNEFDLAVVGGVAEGCFPADFGAFLFYEESVVQNAEAFRGEDRRDGAFTPFC